MTADDQAANGRFSGDQPGDQTDQTDTSGQDDTTDQTDTSGQDDTTDQTDTSGQDDTTDQTDTSGQDDTTDQTDTSGQDDTTDQTDTSGQDDTTDQTDTSGQDDTTDQTDTSGQDDTTDQTDTSGQDDTTDQTDTSGQDDTTDTSDRTGTGDEASTGDQADVGDQGAQPGDQAVGQPASGSVATSGDDPGPPYLIVDQYPFDSGPHPPWGTLVSTAGFYGVILKAWEGAQYNDNGWFKANWSAVRDVAGARYGVTWFRGAYLFLRFAVSGSNQADAYLAAIDQAGGWDHGDIIPIVDVELGDPANPTNLNAKATPQQIVDCTTQCAERIHTVTGKRIMLYGRGAMRDRVITSHMGCDVVWNPSYTAHMVTTGLEPWALEDIVLWQYCGDNVSALPNYPHTVTGFSKIDISVYVKGTQRPTLQMVRDSLLSP